MSSVTWFKLLENRSFDPRGAKLIANGCVVRDMNTLIFDHENSPQKVVNLLILPTEGQDPNPKLPNHTSNHYSCQFTGETTHVVPHSRVTATDEITSTISESEDDYTEVVLKLEGDEGCRKVLYATRGTRRYRIRVFGTGKRLQEVAEALSAHIHVDHRHLLFIFRGKKYDVACFNMVVDDWSDDSKMTIMFNTDHWEDVERRAWCDMQIVRVNEIARSVEKLSRKQTYGTDYTIHKLTWKRDLKEIIENLASDRNSRNEVEMAEVLGNARKILESLSYR